MNESAQEQVTTDALTDDQVRELLRDILTLVRDAAQRLPASKADAKTQVGAAKHYAMGLADGCELTLAQIAEKCRPFVEASGG